MLKKLNRPKKHRRGGPATQQLKLLTRTHLLNSTHFLRPGSVDSAFLSTLPFQSSGTYMHRHRAASALGVPPCPWRAVGKGCVLLRVATGRCRRLRPSPMPPPPSLRPRRVARDRARDGARVRPSQYAPHTTEEPGGPSHEPSSACGGRSALEQVRSSWCGPGIARFPSGSW